MIIDDNMGNLKVLVSMLNVKGYQIRTFTSGQMALKSAQLKKPDLILLDIDMPDMNGYEVCQHFKENDKTKDIPVIFISAFSQTQNIIAGFNAGGVDYITKPFQWQEVIARVNTQIEILKAKRETELILTKTFVGSVQIMADILATTKPDIFHFASRLQTITKKMTVELNLNARWVYEIAALLSMIGYVIFPDERLESYLKGNPHAITAKEKKDALQFSINLISKIPRLDPVVAIFNQYEEKISGERLSEPLATWPQEITGMNLLQLIVRYLEMDSQNKQQSQVFEKIMMMTDLYHKDLIEALIKVELKRVDEKEIIVALQTLKAGMVISQDVLTSEGVKLLKANTEISENLLILIRGYQKHVAINEPIYVWRKETNESFSDY
jgi:DNA-binding response OmpR family regulator